MEEEEDLRSEEHQSNKKNTIKAVLIETYKKDMTSKTHMLK